MSRWLKNLMLLVATLMGPMIVMVLSSQKIRADELLVLMHESGCIERYDRASGQHLGTLLSGLPPTNDLLIDSEGRILISTGNPGEMGTVLRFNPSGEGSVSTLIDVPEGYGGRLYRATGMLLRGSSLFVSSQSDGRIREYSYPDGLWERDFASSTPGSVTQMAWLNDRILLTDFSSHALRLSSSAPDISKAAVWVSNESDSPWGVAVARDGRVFQSTSGNRILCTENGTTWEWCGNDAVLGTPIGLRWTSDETLLVVSLGGHVTEWRESVTPDGNGRKTGTRIREFGGPEMKGPISAVISSDHYEREFAYRPPNLLEATPEKLAFFETHVRPLLAARCLECHAGETAEGGLVLDSSAGWKAGGKSGPALIPGNPDDSLLIRAIRYADKDLQMPPDGSLSAAEVRVMEDWIRSGAIDPRPVAAVPVRSAQSDADMEFQERLDWWSLQPLKKTEPPEVGDSRWTRTPIDRFLRSAMTRAAITPAETADCDTLLRRMAFVLTGLPPSASLRTEFRERWKANADPAVEWLADQLLASPHFGEHFARHWMDVVRYTDTYGYEWDNPARGSHEYRDYLIRAYNGDVGFDVLVREQLAGDLLPEPRFNADRTIQENIIGPMFYHMGEHRHGSSLAFNGIHQEMLNNKIDAFSRAFLATTVACARCHDHKLEAVTQRDYYALGAMFMTPRWCSRPLDGPAQLTPRLKQLEELRNQIRSRVAATWARHSVSAAISHWLAQQKPGDPATIDDVAWPLRRLLPAPDSSELQTVWRDLETEWNTVRNQRRQHNAGFTILEDFADANLPPGWVQEGAGFEFGLVSEATPRIALEGNSVFAELLPRGLHSHALSSRMCGVLHMPPQHQVEGQFLSLLWAGDEYSGSLVLDENTIQNETVFFLKQPQPAWRTYGDAALMNGVTRVTVDFATASLNPNFPPRTGLAAGLPNQDPGYDKRSWLSLLRIVSHNSAGVPQPELDEFAELFETSAGNPVSTPDSARARIEQWLSSIVLRWCHGECRTSDQRVLSWMLTQGLLPNGIEIDPEVAAMVEEYRRIEADLPYPRTVNSLDERQTARAGVYLNLRGNVDAPGDLVEPAFLKMFQGQHSIDTSAGSGRLELAEFLTRSDHPLTARVYVNRVWQWVFGQGLVATPDDFGHLGDRPDHPDLLDWLACDFSANGWSTRHIVRMLVTSEAFRLSGGMVPQSREQDPGNRFLHHYPTRRLEAESIRDSMLAVSGRLDRQLYGRPINPPRLVEDGSKRLFSGPVDGNGRRSLYLTMSIMDPPKFLTVWDLPDLKLPTGKRNVTSVPLQSLLMLNDPFTHQMATHWAERLTADGSSHVDERIRTMSDDALGRPATGDELARWHQLIEAIDTGEAPQMENRILWAEVAHAMFNLPEFIYLR